MLLAAGGFFASQAESQQPLNRCEHHQGPADGGDLLDDLLGAVVAHVRQQEFKGAGEDEGAQQNADDGGGLYVAIGPRQVLTAHQFLDVGVLGRTVERALGRQEKGHSERAPEPTHVVEKRDQQRGDNRREGRPLDDPGLGVFVR